LFTVERKGEKEGSGAIGNLIEGGENKNVRYQITGGGGVAARGTATNGRKKALGGKNA